MILHEKPCELTETKILDLRRNVLAHTEGQVGDLRISILNEEEIVLHGDCPNDESKAAASRGVLEIVPGANVRNRLQVRQATAEQPPNVEWRHAAGRRIPVTGR